MTYCVYMLRCWPRVKPGQGASFYIGITNNMERRFKEHRAGTGGAYTRSRNVDSFVVLQKGLTCSEALKIEIRTKKLTHDQKEELWEASMAKRYLVNV